MDVGRVSLRY